eukprot:3502190-Alexandrium_andersonii.AAC.1
MRFGCLADSYTTIVEWDESDVGHWQEAGPDGAPVFSWWTGLGGTVRGHPRQVHVTFLDPPLQSKEKAGFPR